MSSITNTTTSIAALNQKDQVFTQRLSSMSNPFLQYRHFISLLKNYGALEDSVQIPRSLVEFAADYFSAYVVSKGECHTSTLPMRDFVRNLIKRSQVSCSTVILAMFYMDRLWRKQATTNHKFVSKRAPGRGEFIVALMLADKYLYDIALANVEWARVSNIFFLDELNGMERTFLNKVNFELVVKNSEFEDFLAVLESSLLIHIHQQNALKNLNMNLSDLLKLAGPHTPVEASSTLVFPIRPFQALFAFYQMTNLFNSVCLVASIGVEQIIKEASTPRAPVKRSPPSAFASRKLSACGAVSKMMPSQKKSVSMLRPVTRAYSCPEMVSPSTSQNFTALESLIEADN